MSQRLNTTQKPGDRVGSEWPALLFFLVAPVILVGPHLLPLERVSRIAYVPGDALIFLWEFWWTKHAVAGLHNPYWTEMLYHPSGTSLAFHGYPLTYALLSVPVQLVAPGTFGLFVALKALVFQSFVLAGIGAYFLALRVTGNRWAALVSGAMFTFMPFHFVNMVDLHIAAIEVLPFYVLALLRLAERPSTPRAALLGLLLAVAYYTSLEYALYLVFFSLLWLGYQLVMRRPALSGKHFRQFAAAAACFLLLASPLLWFQIAESRSRGINTERSISELSHWSPALVSFATPSRVHPVYGQAWAFAGEFLDGQYSIRGMRSEATLGWMALLLGFYALAGLRRDERAFWAVAAAVFLVLALGPYLRLTGSWNTKVPLPYLSLYHLVPPLRAGRDPTRFVPLAMLMLSTFAAFGVRDLLRRFDRRHARQLVALTIGALALFETLTPLSAKFIPEVNPLFASRIRAAGDFAVIDLTGDPMSLLHQTVHGKPITSVPNSVPRAASANRLLPEEIAFFYPKSVLAEAPGSAAVEELRESLRRQRIRFVVLPDDRLLARRIRLARRLGARLIREDGLVVCDFVQLLETSAGKKGV